LLSSDNKNDISDSRIDGSRNGSKYNAKNDKTEHNTNETQYGKKEEAVTVRLRLTNSDKVRIAPRPVLMLCRSDKVRISNYNEFSAPPYNNRKSHLRSEQSYKSDIYDYDDDFEKERAIRSRMPERQAYRRRRSDDEEEEEEERRPLRLIPDEKRRQVGIQTTLKVITVSKPVQTDREEQLPAYAPRVSFGLLQALGGNDELRGETFVPKLRERMGSSASQASRISVQTVEVEERSIATYQLVARRSKHGCKFGFSSDSCDFAVEDVSVKAGDEVVVLGFQDHDQFVLSVRINGKKRADHETRCEEKIDISLLRASMSLDYNDFDLN
jgi:hypothetical protein